MTADAHSPVVVSHAGVNPWSPIEVAVFCGCGLARRLVVAHHGDNAHSVGRFTRALRAARAAGTWPAMSNVIGADEGVPRDGTEAYEL